jgi:hypothetical protein
MRLIFFIIMILVSMCIFTLGAADNYETGWHEAEKCNACHNSLLSQSSSDRIFDGCLCHYPPENPIWHTEVDVMIIRDLHGIEPCIKCHINSIGTITKDNMHRLHSEVKCENCHGFEEIKEPDFSSCISCHGNEIHGIHENKLDDLCITCHGEFGADTISQFESADIAVSTNISSISDRNRDTFPTIMRVIRSVLELINI